MPRRRRAHTPDGPPFVGDLVELDAGPIVFGGASLSRLDDGRVVFVSFAVPGERVEVRVEKTHADYLEGAVERVLTPAPGRVEPRCGLFGQCGGCQLQHMAYPDQLTAKEAIVREQLERIGHLDPSVVRPIRGAAKPWGYRNHARFSTGHTFGDLGFVHRRGRGLLTVESCPIAHPMVNAILPRLQRLGKGLHQVQVRCSEATGSVLINPAVPGAPMETGQREYTERLAGHDFVVADSAFFQVNSAQAEVMIELIGGALPERGRLLVDGFAGVGTFAVIFAERFERVIAIEESASAARHAAVNLAQAPNVEMLTGKVETVLPDLGLAPDAVVLDPPRPGCAPPVIEALTKSRPATIVYVSCNPSTLARDLRLLVDGGYRLDWVTPLDMFPQTGHIECVTKLSALGRPALTPGPSPDSAGEGSDPGPFGTTGASSTVLDLGGPTKSTTGSLS
ncbi:MAG: class I SAM-dependent RNA methyltransferase, partial [Dehalococcoidia bacterium]